MNVNNSRKSGTVTIGHLISRAASVWAASCLISSFHSRNMECRMLHLRVKNFVWISMGSIVINKLILGLLRYYIPWDYSALGCNISASPCINISASPCINISASPCINNKKNFDAFRTKEQIHLDDYNKLQKNNKKEVLTTDLEDI